MESDRGYLARLLDAEDVAGAADFEVAHGDFHPASIAARFDEGVEPFAGWFGKADVFRNEKIGVGGPVPAADSAAELVEVGEAVGVGPIDENRVGVGDIDAVFYDRRREEEVDLPLFETVEDLRRRHRCPSGHGRRRCGPTGRVSGCASARP